MSYTEEMVKALLEGPEHIDEQIVYHLLRDSIMTGNRCRVKTILEATSVSSECALNIFFLAACQHDVGVIHDMVALNIPLLPSCVAMALAIKEDEPLSAAFFQMKRLMLSDVLSHRIIPRQELDQGFSWVLRRNDVDMARAILQAEGLTAEDCNEHLKMAVTYHHRKMVKAILEYGKVTVDMCVTQFEEAIRVGKVGIVSVFLKSGKIPKERIEAAHTLAKSKQWAGIEKELNIAMARESDEKRAGHDVVFAIREKIEQLSAVKKGVSFFRGADKNITALSHMLQDYLSGMSLEDAIAHAKATPGVNQALFTDLPKEGQTRMTMGE